MQLGLVLWGGFGMLTALTGIPLFYLIGMICLPIGLGIGIAISIISKGTR